MVVTKKLADVLGSLKKRKKSTNTGYLLFKESLKLLMYDSEPCFRGMVGGTCICQHLTMMDLSFEGKVFIS